MIIMTWVSKLLFGAPWPPSQVERYEVDVKALTLGGLGRGDSSSLIAQRFGPPDSYRSRRRGLYRYEALGLAFFTSKRGKLEGFSVYGPGAGGGFGVFTGRWLSDNRKTEQPGEPEFIDVFGEPTGRHDDDPEGPSLEWSTEEVEAYADFDNKGQLAEFGVAFP
jgi:hypothetical protein